MNVRLNDYSGFTLIEVMVALVILSVLSVLSAQALKSGVDNRATMSADISRESKVADALRIMRADIARAYNYRDPFAELQAPPAQLPGGSLPTPAATPKVTTGFIGEKESLYFTSLANVRVMKDSPESDQAKIGYFVKGCTLNAANPSNAQASKCLYRSISPYLDQEIAKPGEETVLLENIEEFQLRYIGPEKDEPQTTWKTGEAGDAVTKDKFPYAVEITVRTLNKNDKKDKPVEAIVLAPLHFPNNPKKKKEGEPGTSNGGSGGSTGAGGGSSGGSAGSSGSGAP